MKCENRKCNLEATKKVTQLVPETKPQDMPTWMYCKEHADRFYKREFIFMLVAVFLPIIIIATILYFC